MTQPQMQQREQQDDCRVALTTVPTIDDVVCELLAEREEHSRTRTALDVTRSNMRCLDRELVHVRAELERVRAGMVESRR